MIEFLRAEDNIGPRMNSSCQRILAYCVAMAVWCFAVGIVWKNSSLGGGNSHFRAKEVATQVSDIGNLTEDCRKLAADLAEAETRVRVAAKRPTWHMFSEQRNAIVEYWLNAGCPARAIPGIAFGAAEAARAVVNDRGKS